jgi:hypothetical protein
LGHVGVGVVPLQQRGRRASRESCCGRLIAHRPASPPTHGSRVAQQARNLLMDLGDVEQSPTRPTDR